MKRMVFPQVFLVLSLVCAVSGHAAPPDFFRGKIRMQDRNEGYALLYELASSESDVDKLFIIKSANTNITSLITEIAESAGRVRDQLDAFAEKDRYLRFNEKHLPLIELRTRADIETATRNELLFSAGHNFEMRLLFTQAQAMQYGAFMAKQIRDTEDNQERKDYLDGVVKKWDEFYQRVMKLLLPKE
jgi:hypothetical protein